MSETILDDETKAKVETETPSIDFEKTLGTKGKRGRHAKDCQCEACQKKREKSAGIDDETEQIKNEFSESISEAGEFLLEFINPRLPNPQPINAIEKQMFANGLKKVANKYFTGVFKYDAEFTLLLGLGIFIAPRIKKPVKKEVEIIQSFASEPE